jgi:hypothetical protein
LRNASLEEKLTPVQRDFARYPRQRHRLIVCNIGSQLSLETSTCRRTLNADGSITEIVRLNGTRADLPDADLDKFIEGFPIQPI